MDPDQRTNKASGLPRPSKLPVLRNKLSQLSFSTQGEPVDESKGNVATAKVQKRQSIASLPRAAKHGSKEPIVTSKPLAARGDASSNTKSTPLKSTVKGSHPSVMRPSSRGNQQRQPTRTTQTISTTEDEENHDRLGSLDSFRSASRQGTQDESPLERKEFIEPAELPKGPRERRPSRPSLSDRTIGSIQNLPATPKERRRSSFFSTESPMGPPPRPTSSLSRNGSNSSSRPGTSDGTFGMPPGRAPPVAKHPVSAKRASRTSLGGFGFTPNRSVSRNSANNRQDSKDLIPPVLRSPSPSKQAGHLNLSNGFGKAKNTPKSKTVAARPSKPRPALADAFVTPGKSGVATHMQQKEQQTHSHSTTPPSSKRVMSNPTNSSSAALRQQIAAAKAAARKDKEKHDSAHDVQLTGGSDIESNALVDPFNQAPRDGKHVLRNRIGVARMDGKLNIAAMSLKQIPDEVMHMYDASVLEVCKVSWAEVVDLTRLNAADNEIEELADAVFPDVSAEELAENDDQTAGNQFGGLETLDLHGNKLQALPMGLRRLERLTMLNLSHNALENSALDVVAQISTLKDLKLGHNGLSNNLPSSLCNFRNLESLDLQCNRLLGLPEAIRELVSLKVLNVSNNQLTALPMDALEALPLTELDASSNALISALFPPTCASAHPTLRILRAANNSLAALTFSHALDLPQLRTLDVNDNHITLLPPMSGWEELNTLTAADNKIAELPAGFASLRNLRNVNLTSNELRILDPEVARMESLQSLVLASNPLIEKRFLTMSAADIKRDLQARLEPLLAETMETIEQGDSHDARNAFSPPAPTTKGAWPLQPGGKLELAGRGYTDEINDSLGSFLKSHETRRLYLSSNKLTAVPPALWLGQELRVLDLSGNTLGSDYFFDELSLPSLQELNLSRCSLTTLEPLTTQLQAPSLQTLNIAVNRLTGTVPLLRKPFPVLSTLFASDNRFMSVMADSLRGLQMVNLASNDIQQLPGEIGLLWDEGLRSLEVGTNAFRVPNHRVLEKGTEALMRYLRDRIPAAQFCMQNGLVIAEVVAMAPAWIFDVNGNKVGARTRPWRVSDYICEYYRAKNAIATSSKPCASRTNVISARKRKLVHEDDRAPKKPKIEEGQVLGIAKEQKGGIAREDSPESAFSKKSLALTDKVKLEARD
ncbi:hypothetical protein LTR37_013291 [Vermiconidia calcicola]|uniref:Uncharacterized protein n=1 Tax=Vermiconidia calcicola TaxID=1690605 RepID=A0ACC3MYF1_9PEZI|nr:hypothetical protein LTR37_013291 [Vermiconidia calcicola]